MQTKAEAEAKYSKHTFYNKVICTYKTIHQQVLALEK